MEFYLPTANDSVSIALSNDVLGQPGSSPALVLPLVGPLILPFALTPNVSVYITAKTGNPFFRYV